MIPLRDLNPSGRPPVATYALIGLNAVGFAVELSLPPDEMESFLHVFGLVPARFTHPAWSALTGLPPSPVPWLTSMFLHGGWMHLIGNVWFLWIFGDNVEDRMGPLRFTAFYLLCGLIASLSHLVLNWRSPVPVIGASGAIAGVMGAYMLLYPYARVLTLVVLGFLVRVVPVPAVFFIGLWAVYQLMGGAAALGGGAASQGIAFWAHVGGFVAGALLLRVFVRPRRRGPRPFL